MPYSWVISLVLFAALAGSGLLLKGQIQTNGELKQSLHETSAALERVATVVREQEAEKHRLSTLLSEREEAIRDSAKAVSKGKDTLRVEAVKSTTFGRCTDVLLPADVVRGLRDGAGSGGSDSEGTAAKPASASLQSSGNTGEPYRY